MKKASAKKYTVKQRYEYHSDRYFSCGKHGIEFGSPKHCYSMGFRDAFFAHDNTGAITHEFESKCGKAYNHGYERGNTAAREYFKTTGKQPSNIGRN